MTSHPPRPLRDRLLALREQVYAVALALRHPRTPWYAKAIAAGTIAYFLAPIDLIPDPIPILGHLDDLLIVPLGVWLVIRLTPREVMQECRDKARKDLAASPRAALVVTLIIVAVWILILAALAWVALNIFRARPGPSTAP